ncbi:Predicted cobalt transporter CbtA [hydrothermal vent metagenome]|uniref:Predicted cobalt transporter CbtA n=1 Tax=hydrothermal vent metagenome TaxID=652676 RepID=A0A3B0TCI5_9ZZZZ
MQLFQRVFFAAVLAGLAAGLVLSAIQQWRVVPLIIQAELYEINDVHALEHANDPVPAGPHLHPLEGENISGEDLVAAEAPETGFDFERAGLTVLASVLTGLGYALVLGAVSIFANIPINRQNGLMWGLAGFVSVALMPSIGLPPELPGMVAAEIGPRQIWWIGTVLISSLAIYVLYKNPNPAGLLIGLGLILVPHIMGAPVPPAEPASVPAALVLIYVANAMFSLFAFWLTLGFAFGWFNQKLNKEEGA